LQNQKFIKTSMISKYKNNMFFFYQIIILFIILISPLIIIFRIFKNKEHKKRFLEKFGFNSQYRKRGELIWFHGSSVGEIMSIIPLIHYYENNKSIDQILITSSTLSSSNILRRYKFKKTVHQFFPIDFFFITKKFLKYWKPSIAIFVESEIWPSIFKILDKKKIPLILLNARITSKSFNQWLIFESYAKSVFNKISYSYPQNTETLKYLKKLDVKNINFIGNLKFIENPYDKTSNFKKNLKSIFSSYKIWVAASTHHDEEVVCANAHIILKRKINNLITIIIPRHINRTNEIISKISNLGLKVIRHSSKIKKLDDSDIYLVDSYGESRKFYEIAKTVFLGGSLTNRGGQNPLEAARYGAKILHGKNIQNFEDIYKYLKKLNFTKSVNSPKNIASSIDFKLFKKKDFIIKNLGDKIFRKTITELNSLIKNAN